MDVLFAIWMQSLTVNEVDGSIFPYGFPLSLTSLNRHIHILQKLVFKNLIRLQCFLKNTTNKEVGKKKIY